MRSARREPPVHQVPHDKSGRIVSTAVCLTEAENSDPADRRGFRRRHSNIVHREALERREEKIPLFFATIYSVSHALTWMRV